MRPFFKNIKNRFNNTAEAIAMPAFSTEYFELISFFKEISSRIKSSEGMLKLLKKLLKPIKFTYWEDSIMYEDRLGYKVNVYIPRETSHRIIKIIARILKDYSVKEIFEIMAQAFDLNNLRDIDLSGVQKKVSDFEISLKDRWSKVRAFGKDHLRKTKEKTEKLSIKKLKAVVLKWLDDASDYMFKEDGFNYSEVYEGIEAWMNPFEIELQRLNESFDFDSGENEVEKGIQSYKEKTKYATDLLTYGAMVKAFLTLRFKIINKENEDIESSRVLYHTTRNILDEVSEKFNMEFSIFDAFYNNTISIDMIIVYTDIVSNIEREKYSYQDKVGEADNICSQEYIWCWYDAIDRYIKKLISNEKELLRNWVAAKVQTLWEKVFKGKTRKALVNKLMTLNESFDFDDDSVESGIEDARNSEIFKRQNLYRRAKNFINWVFGPESKVPRITPENRNSYFDGRNSIDGIMYRVFGDPRRNNKTYPEYQKDCLERLERLYQENNSDLDIGLQTRLDMETNNLYNKYLYNEPAKKVEFVKALNETFDFDQSSSVDDGIESVRTLMRQRYGNFLEYKNMVFETVQTLIKALYPTYKTKSSEETISKIDDVLNYIFNFSIDVNDRVFKFNAYYDECDLFEIIEKSYGIPSEENVVFSGYFMKCLEDFFNYFFEEISSPSGQAFKEALDKEVKVFRKNFEKAKMKGFL